MSATDAPAVTHIAGFDVLLEGRYLRQRCAWCDHVLIDEDLSRVMVEAPADGEPPRPLPTWPVGALVEVSGGVSALVGDNGAVPLPANSCTWAALATADDFTTPLEAMPGATSEPAEPGVDMSDPDDHGMLS